jgi:hypothetical protein
MTEVSAKRIGYLRMAPTTEQAAVSPSGPVKSMWRKLQADGLLNVSGDKNQKFWLSEAGVAAIKKHDDTLSEPVRAVLNAVKAGQSGAAAMKGMMTAINAGLVRVGQGTRFTYTLTEAGKLLADPIGETGYFTKSGNKVYVRGLDSGATGEVLLDVERVDGESKGKGMLISRRSFVREAGWPAFLGED